MVYAAHCKSADTDASFWPMARIGFANHYEQYAFAEIHEFAGFAVDTQFTDACECNSCRIVWQPPSCPRQMSAAGHVGRTFGQQALPERKATANLPVSAELAQGAVGLPGNVSPGHNAVR